MPLALAALFSLLLLPAVAFLEKLRLPRVLAILVVVAALFGLVGLVIWKTSQQFTSLTDQLPTYKKTLEDKIAAVKGTSGGSLTKASTTVNELEKEISAPAPASAMEGEPQKSRPSATTARPLPVQIVPPANPLESLENLLGPLATALIVVVFTIFILYGREDLRNRLIRLAGRSRLNVMTQAMDEATQRVHRYLLLQLLVNTGYGLVIAIALHFIGIPNAALWGIAAGVLRFLPYIGPPLAALMPILLSLAVFPGWRHALMTAGLFFVLELVVSNFVEPLLYGAHIGLSPLAILVAAVFWTLLWGFPGLVLSTPLTVCLVVIGRYVPGLGFFSVLLGDEPPLTPQAQYYQRLLAGDQSEARQVLEQCLKEKSLEEVYSVVLIPALGLAEVDRHRNELDESTENFIFQSTREIIEELEELPRKVSKEEATEAAKEVAAEAASDIAQEPVTATRGLRVLCIPARDEADEVVAILLTRLLELRGHYAESIALRPVAEMLAEVKNANPDVVCISALPPFALNYTRSLYAKLRAQSPELRIAICLWQFDGDREKVRTTLRIIDRHELFTTLPNVLKQIAKWPNNHGSDARAE